ncbi:choline/ethanolamine kinase family protein [Sporosarcina sp. G11-34]|uniref:choline/ethanolamine kinase family protein n=1 Tax=Sporosarcina sp. G11-34 TaxID=2849605 RepID=UPI0022A995D3|nr:choline/ethanolamine kinase family protein [Sporosarcina sp. G11-34]MCZ2260287.1 phosphotransferase family protein [Sporosarcina sp. G11-34]
MENLKDTIREALKLPNAEIENIGISGGMTNLNYHVLIDSVSYIVRVPGNGTKDIINRVEEKENLELGTAIGINPELRYFNVNTGLKITKKIENARTVTKNIAENEGFMKSIAVIFRRLHKSNKVMGNKFKLFEMMTTYENLGLVAGAELFDGFEEVKRDILRLKKHYETLDIEIVPCHIDPAFSNFILDEDDIIYLIDWEYSGMFDPMWDIAAYSLEAGYSASEEDLFVNYYLQREATALEKERIHLHKVFQDYLWSLWTLFKEEKGDDFGTYGKNRFERAKKNIIVFDNTYVQIQ